MLIMSGPLPRVPITGGWSTITVALHGGLGVDTYQVIDISAINDNQTKMIGHYSIGPVDKYGNILKEWVFGNSTECSLKNRQ